MKTNKILLIIVGLLSSYSCEKELSITEFSDDFSNYEPELRIEALILPIENTAIVRVDKSYTLMDTTLYDCIDNDYGRTTEQECIDLEGFWHGDADSTIANCGDWNKLIHDVGIDGEIGDPTDDDGDCEDCNYGDTICQENCRNEDSIGENNEVPDCNEPNVDNYAEFLPNIHQDEGCIISMKKIYNDSSEEVCEFTFNPDAGSFFDTQYNGTKGRPLIEDLYSVNYGAYVPDGNCSTTMWVNEGGGVDTESKYHFNADCTEAGFGNITSKDPITVSDPVVFVDTIFDPTIQNPKNQMDVAEYLENLGIENCADYNCLEENKLLLENNFAYFPRYSDSTFVLWATISPNVYFQAVQYMYDSTEVNSVYFHGHPSVGTEFLNIVDNICLMGETIISDYYDGYGNGEWDDSTDNEEDNKGSAEIFADKNGNGKYDEGEIFIDTGDNVGDIDTYYYEISTFSESYKNYYYYPQLLPNDPVRSNLRDENMNTVMGAFGSITTNKINFKIIDCLDFTIDADKGIDWTYETQEDCENNSVTHGVCKWYENKTIDFYNESGDLIEYDGEVCAPINFWE